MEHAIAEFYKAFENKEAEKMVSFYHDDIKFTDPAFGTLEGEHAKNMWRMLIEGSTDLKLEVSDIEASDTTGKAHWVASYSFSRTGRKVVNRIDAKFKFKDGKIIEHVDTFDLHKWAKQAIGFKGLLFGGTNFFKRKLNEQTTNLLAKFEKTKKA